MSEQKKRRRVGPIKARTRVGDKEYITQNFGAVLTTDWEGNYSLILEVDTDEKQENGYPVRARLAAAKFLTPDNKEIKMSFVDDDGKPNTYFNFIAYEDLPKSPPRDNG